VARLRSNSYNENCSQPEKSTCRFVAKFVYPFSGLLSVIRCPMTQRSTRTSYIRTGSWRRLPYLETRRPEISECSGLQF
jgi:hypothetical protein